MKGTVSRIAIGGAIATLFATIAIMPASAAPTPLSKPVVSIANPSPGAYLHRGQNWVVGVACDPTAPMSDPTAGISSVSLYLADRDNPVNAPSFRPGGYFGRASAALPGAGNPTASDFSPSSSSSGGLFSHLGIPSPDVSTCKQTFAGWRILPSSFRKGTFDFNFYVIGKNGAETKVTIAGIRIDKP